MSKPFSRSDDSFLGRWYWTIDKVIIGVLAILMLIGILMVATASPAVAERIGLSPYFFLKKHVMLLAPCIFAIAGISMISTRNLWRICSIGIIVAITGLLVVLASGDAVKGATRWISIFGQSLQPSEFTKPFFAVVAAWILSKGLAKNTDRGVYIVLAIYGFIIALLLLQPDLGTSIQISAVLAVQFVLLGMPMRLASIILAGGAGGIFIAYKTLPHVHSRIDRFLNPESGDTYQVDKSLDSFSNGGFFGVGPGHGTIKESLPDAHADFILSVAGEEMGAIFVWFILAMFLLLIWQGFRRLSQSQDMFSILAGGGLLAMFGIQVAIHTGSAINLIPAKGMTLPFVSYGGSALLSSSLSAGMILAFTRNRGQTGIAKGSLSPTGSPTI